MRSGSSVRPVLAVLALAGALLGALWAGAAGAQATERKDPTVLRGLVFLPDPAALRKEGWTAPLPERVDVSRTPALHAEAFSKLMEKFLDKPIGPLFAQVITDAVTAYYRGIRRPFVRVTVPEQDITSGIVQVLVVEGRIGRIGVEGAQWFGEGQYRDALGQKAGERIDLERLQADIDWLNRNTYRRATILTAPGSEVGTTDVVIRTEEEFPLRFTAGFENTGNPATHENRVTAGIEWGNLFDRGHILGYRLIGDPDFDRLTSHSIYASIFLPWRHVLTLNAGRTESSSQPLIGFDLDGESADASARYLVPLRGGPGFSHEATVGFDFKRANNFLAFGVIQVFDTTSEIAQFSLGYNGSADDRFGVTRFNAALFMSPGNLTGNNRDEDFEAQRASARAKYAYFRGLVERNTALPWPGASWNVRATAQLASENLLPSEQLSFGGYQSVRGFGESIAVRDIGFLLSNELRSPPFGGELFRSLGLPLLEERVQALLFLDYGVGRAHDEQPGERSRVRLASFGPGLRFALGRHVSARLDFGVWRGHSGIDNPRRENVHFGIQVSF